MTNDKIPRTKARCITYAAGPPPHLDPFNGITFVTWINFEIVGEVLAEGWAKSLTDWHKQNRQPIRFSPVPAKPVHPALVPPLSALTADVS